MMDHENSLMHEEFLEALATEKASNLDEVRKLDAKYKEALGDRYNYFVDLWRKKEVDKTGLTTEQQTDYEFLRSIIENNND